MTDMRILTVRCTCETDHFIEANQAMPYMILADCWEDVSQSEGG